MIPEPDPAESILDYDHSYAYQHGVGSADPMVAGEAEAAEDETAEYGLEEIIGEAHTAEYAQMMQDLAESGEGIPAGNHCGNDHEEDA